MAMVSIAAGAVNASTCAPFAGASKLRKSRLQSYPGTALVQCSSEKSQPPSGSFCAGCKKVAAAESGGSFRLSAVVVPMLAAALVGSFQPAVQASDWEKNLVPVDSETSSPYSNDAAYKDLVQRMKDRRAKRGSGTAPTPAPPADEDDEPEDEKSGSGFSGFPSPFQFAPPPLYSSQAEKAQEKSKPFEVKPSPGVSKPFSSPSQATPPSFFSSPAEKTEEKSEPSEEKPSQGFFNPFASFFSSPSPAEKIEEKVDEKVEEKSEPSEETPSPGFNPFSSFQSFFSAPPFLSTPEQEKTPAVAEAPVAPPVAKELPAEVPEKAAEIFDNGEPAEKEKTHGFMPLFLSQLLLLITFVGGGFLLITTPQSTWDDLQKTVDKYVEKATPLVEDAWVKAQPIAVQAQQKVGEFAVKAKPFVEKAWEASKPMAAKAVEASKPILKGAQAKAMELLEQARSK